MDLNNPVIKYCVEGTQAEFIGQIEAAQSLYQQAWDAVTNDFEACVAAHYMARFQEDPQKRLFWNHLALEHANEVKDQRTDSFYPSLYLNLGQSYELLGKSEEAKHYYDLAAKLGVIHQAD